MHYRDKDTFAEKPEKLLKMINQHSMAIFQVYY